MSSIASQIRDAGGEAIALGIDLTSAERVREMIDLTVRHYGRLDILYNNASRTRFILPFHDTTLDDWEFVVRNELTSVFLCCKYAVPAMLEGGGGSIVNVGSIGGMVGMGYNGNVIHGTVKAAVIGLTKNLAVEYAGQGIRVNVICPGPIESQANAARLRDPQRAAATLARVPIGRWGQPEDIAPLALYLASDESSYVTGAIFVADGGWTAQ